MQLNLVENRITQNSHLQLNFWVTIALNMFLTRIEEPINRFSSYFTIHSKVCDKGSFETKI